MDRTATQLPARPLDGPNSAPLSLSLSLTHIGIEERRAPLSTAHPASTTSHFSLPGRRSLEHGAGHPWAWPRRPRLFGPISAIHRPVTAPPSPTTGRRSASLPSRAPLHSHFHHHHHHSALYIQHFFFFLSCFSFFFLIPGEGFIFSNILQFFWKKFWNLEFELIDFFGKLKYSSGRICDFVIGFISTCPPAPIPASTR